jgi:hypothetical protein
MALRDGPQIAQMEGDAFGATVFGTGMAATITVHRATTPHLGVYRGDCETPTGFG